MKFYATCVPGIEDLASKEIKKYGAKIEEIRKGKGKLFFKGKKELVWKLNYFSRLLERVLLLLERKEFLKLEDIYNISKRVDYSFIQEKQSFAVRAKRVGKHGFTSLDIAREVGQGIIDSYLKTKRKRLKVDLNNPDVIIRAEVVENEFILGLDLTGDKALHKRWWRVYNHPAHLNTTIACAMLELAKWNWKRSLLDPLCGSGTILIEAAMKGKSIPPGKNREFAFEKIFGKKKIKFKEYERTLNLTGIEKFKKHLEGAKQNAENAEVKECIKFFHGEIEKIKLNQEFSCIITNPPYGIRIGKKGTIPKLYENLLEKAKEWLSKEEKARLVIITSEDSLLKKLSKKKNFEIEQERLVIYGDLPTKIFILKR